MKRITISLLALFIISINAVHAQKPFFEVNGIFYRLVERTPDGVSQNVIVAVSNIGDVDYYKGEVSIPATVSYNGVNYPVREIADNAFKGSRQLTSITIPASVTRIPAGAFYGCKSLTTIKVASGNSVYDSRDNCNAVIETATNTLIAGCDKSVIPSSVPTIGDCAFWGTGITKLNIPSHVSSVGNWAFLDCSDMTSLTISYGVDSIGIGAFKGCSNLASVEFPNSIKKMATAAFDGNYNIETLYWNHAGSPRGLLSSNTHTIVLGDSVRKLSMNYLTGSKGLKNVILSSNVEYIDPRAFTGCENIEYVFWNSKDSINGGLANVIRSSKATVTKLEVGPKGTIVDIHGLAGCTNLASITIDPQNPLFDSRNNCNAVIEKSTGKFLLGCRNSFIPDGIKEIGDEAFMNIIGLQSITIPSSVKAIGYDAFSSCTALTSLNIPEKVESISGNIVLGCTALNSITVNTGNTSYDSRSSCNAIIETKTNRLIAGCKKSTVPQGVVVIGKEAFRGCAGLISVDLPSSLKSIEKNAFEGCADLTTVKTPASMNMIGEEAFKDCSSLLSFNIPQGVKVIEYGLFGDCSSLATVSIPSSVDSIAYCAFINCTSLKSVTIPEGVTAIQDKTFSGCKSLEYLSVPSTVVSFGREIYKDCESLLSAGPKGGGYNYEFSWKDTIPVNAFFNLKSLRSVYIPKTVKAVYECDETLGLRIEAENYYPSSVFYGCDYLNSVSVSFKDTKLIRFYINPRTYYSRFEESPMDYNLYKLNPVQSITILDDSIARLSSALTSQIKKVILSKNVNAVESGAFSFSPYSVTVGYNSYTIASMLQSISVENGNKHFCSVNGVLFNKECDLLLAYPSGREGGYTVPTSVKGITANSFRSSNGLKEVMIPDNVEWIGEKAFSDCRNMDRVTIEGSPKIDKYAFWNSPHIEDVISLSRTPGIMSLYDEPQTILVGDAGSFSSQGGVTVKPSYNNELGRSVSEISASDIGWTCTINTEDVPAGLYRLSVGILPSSDGLPNLFHPAVMGVADDRVEYIFDPKTKRGARLFPINYTNDVTGYDSVFLVDSLDIQEGYKGLMITIKNAVNNSNADQYSNTMILDRIFFEPLDKDAAPETFAGPFTMSVFNNATLYVPEGTISTYQAADGWKLFKRIAISTDVDAVQEDEPQSNKGEVIIYDMMGRRLRSESTNLLAPGLYVIDGKTYFIK